MKTGNQLLFLVFLLTGSSALAQIERKITFDFNPVFAGNTINLSDTVFISEQKDSIQIETLKFYLSGFELWDHDKPVYKEKHSYHLLDASKMKSMSFNLRIPSDLVYDKIVFHLGIDSATNVAGAMGGDLDPTRGMYWSWQSGYINFKLEGRSAKCRTQNNEFTYHLGGYLSPFQSIQIIEFPVQPIEKVQIKVDMQKFFNSIDISKQNQTMSPGLEANELSKKLSAIFYVQ